jgi:hypothetical protein
MNILKRSVYTNKQFFFFLLFFFYFFVIKPRKNFTKLGRKRYGQFYSRKVIKDRLSFMNVYGHEDYAKFWNKDFMKAKLKKIQTDRCFAFNKQNNKYEVIDTKIMDNNLKLDFTKGKIYNIKTSE